ncbi:cell division control protein 2 homolog isoform X2 [Actinidia eriantha]|nr:cell division control protein 2 homolog isoform X2 [Actinidia eriantha]XP_057470753.1 cell division control protein 2 homolog isoform X2 [Actinidia eriantha]
MEKYNIIATIGQGSFGSVDKARTNDTNEIVALKRINFPEVNEGVPSSVIREISLMRDMEHSNIIRLLDVVDSENTVYLVLEYMDLDLKNFINSSPNLARNPQMIKNLLHQLLRGLAYCHSFKVLHRDLKPQNLLIDTSKNILKLADFGSAREFGVPLAAYTEGEKVATLWYKAPELILGDRKYSTSVDMWSVGCIFAEMVTKNPLFAMPNVLYQMSEIFSIMGKPNEKTWPGVTSLCDFLDSYADCEPKDLAEVVLGLEPAGVDLLSKMLCMDPKRRIMAYDALKHPYFGDLGRP